MSIWLLWLLIVVCPALDLVCGLMAIIFGIILIANTLLHAALTIDDTAPKELIPMTKKIFVYFLPIFIITMFLAIISPDEKQIKYIVGGYFVTNIDGIEKLPPNLVKSANKFLEDYSQDTNE